MKFLGALLVGLSVWAGFSAWRRRFPSAPGGPSKDFDLKDVIPNYQDQNPRA